MRPHARSLRALALIAGIALLTLASSALADPPARVARLGYLNGTVSFSPAGEDYWVDATVNRPLTTGDRLWADRGARSEIQVGGATIRMSAGTSVAVLNLDDRITQLQLTQGVLNVRVWRADPDQTFEVDTPNLAFVPRQAGSYRIEVDPDRDETRVVVRNGRGDVYGDDTAYTIDTRQAYLFSGTSLRDYRIVDFRRPDEFDRWAIDRDRGYEQSVSARYVSRDVIGYQDLDAHGTWRAEPEYGNVWVPSRVPAGWSPYRDGHWAWIDPWGWTWVDDAPWGFAVSHYGRWANTRGSWVWVPGPVSRRAYYAPALVAFVGGDNFQLSISSGNVGGVAWFPLGPREVYRPSYPVSRRYYENVNISNTVINTTVINNTYNTVNVNNVYVNRRVAGAVIAVPTTTFVQSQPVARAAAPVTRELVASAPVANAPRIAPTERSVRGTAEQRERPPERALARPVVARAAPPAARPGFAAQQPQLSAQPGKPLEEDARRNLKPAASAPVVNVVTQPQQATKALPAPPASADSRSADAKGKSAERKGAEAARTAPPEQRGKSEPRPQASSPPAAPQPQAPTASAAPSQRTAPPAPAAQAPEARGKADDRSKSDQDSKSGQRAPAAAPPPPQQQAGLPAKAAPQPSPPPPQAAQRPAPDKSKDKSTDKSNGKKGDADEEEKNRQKK